MNFVCAGCDEDASEVVMRRCEDCAKSWIAGYRCDCGHEDVDPPGQEWGHAARHALSSSSSSTHSANAGSEGAPDA